MALAQGGRVVNVAAMGWRSDPSRVLLHRPRWAHLVSLCVAVGFAALITLTSGATAGLVECVGTGTGGCTVLTDCCQAPAGACQMGTCCSLNGGNGSCTDATDCCSPNAECSGSECCLPTGTTGCMQNTECCQAPAGS